MSESVSGAQKTAASVEAVVNGLLPAAAAFGPTGAAVGAGVGVAESVANAILSATASHEAPAAIATGAVTALAANSAPIIAALPEADQAKAHAALSLWQEAVAAWKAIFG